MHMERPVATLGVIQYGDIRKTSTNGLNCLQITSSAIAIQGPLLVLEVWHVELSIVLNPSNHVYREHSVGPWEEFDRSGLYPSLSLAIKLQETTASFPCPAHFRLMTHTKGVLIEDIQNKGHDSFAMLRTTAMSPNLVFATTCSLRRLLGTAYRKQYGRTELMTGVLGLSSTMPSPTHFHVYDDPVTPSRFSAFFLCSVPLPAALRGGGGSRPLVAGNLYFLSRMWLFHRRIGYCTTL